MATYLPNITEYIPQAQKFSPDYNFYSTILQGKQDKFDAANKQLSGIYGTLLNSPMLRDQNNKRRDDFFNMINGDIKKISGLDLSRPENVDAAYKVFEPFYNDKNMVKDIVWTKNWQHELNRGEGYRNCIDPEKCGGSYWEDGVTALQYKADEFRKASDDQALTMDSPKFVPFVNANQKAMKFAKEMGFNITGTTTDGRYITTTTNGEQMILPLDAMFMSQFGEDPAIQDVYNTKAYLQRKNYISQNSAQLGGDDKAEQQYFNKMQEVVDKSKQKQKDTEAMTNTINSKVALAAATIKNNGAFPNSDLAKTYQNLVAQAKAASSLTVQTTATSNLVDSLKDAQGNIETLRNRYDGIMSSNLFAADMMDSATEYSFLTSSTDIKADPYGVQAQAFSNSLSLAALNHQFAMEENVQKQQLKDASDLAAITASSEFNNPDHQVVGDAASDNASPYKEIKKDINDKALDMDGLKKKFVVSSINYLQGMLTGSPEESKVAKDILLQIDPKHSNAFITPGWWNGNVNYADLYSKLAPQMQSNRNIDGDWYNNNLKGTDDQIASVRSWMAADKVVLAGNNKNIRDFAKASTMVKDGDKPFFDALFDSQNNLVDNKSYIDNFVKNNHKAIDDLYNKSKFVNIIGSSDQDLWKAAVQSVADDAKSKYEDMVDKYKEIYDSDTKIGGSPLGLLTKSKFNTPLPLITPLTGSADFNNSSGGKATQRTTYKMDSALAGATGNALANDLYTKLMNADPTTKIEYQNDPEGLKKDIVMHYLQQMQTRTKGDNLNRPQGTIGYQSIANSDSNTSSITITPDMAWLKANGYYGGGTNKGSKFHVLYDQLTGESSPSITIDVPKSFGDQLQFGQLMQQPYYDHILLAGPYTYHANLDPSMYFTVTKNQDGNAVLQGKLYAYDGDVKKSFPLSFTGDSNVGADELIKQYQEIVNQQATLNKEYEESLSGKIHDPNQLLEPTQ